MKILRNNNGMALVMVLILSVICLAMSSGILYFVTQSTRISGSHKRYETANQAANGGSAVTFQLASSRGDEDNFNHPSKLALDNLTIPSSDVGGVNCITEKLLKNTVDWDAVCNSSLSIDKLNSNTYDMAFDLGTYDVYSKVVDTVPGNTAIDTGLIKNAVVKSDSGEVNVKHLPYIYTIEIQSSQPNLNERAISSILYFY
jgi:hypothetical protein